jgi:anti-sigma B factor antagonist
MSDQEPLAIRSIDGGAALVGEIDANTAGRLTQAFDGPGDLVLDLSGVEFVDSSGLRVLIELHQNRSQAGGSLVLRTPSPAVRRLLEVSGVADYLTVDDGTTS